MKKQCKVCDKHFEAKNYWQKYCSVSCKQAMWAIRKFKSKKVIKDILEKDVYNER